MDCMNGVLFCASRNGLIVSPPVENYQFIMSARTVGRLLSVCGPMADHVGNSRGVVGVPTCLPLSCRLCPSGLRIRLASRGDGVASCWFFQRLRPGAVPKSLVVDTEAAHQTRFHLQGRSANFNCRFSRGARHCVACRPPAPIRWYLRVQVLQNTRHHWIDGVLSRGMPDRRGGKKQSPFWIVFKQQLGIARLVDNTKYTSTSCSEWKKEHPQIVGPLKVAFSRAKSGQSTNGNGTVSVASGRSKSRKQELNRIE